MANKAPHGCTNPEIGSLIRAYLDRSVSTRARASFGTHLGDCTACAKLLERATDMGMATPDRSDAPWRCTNPEVGRYANLFVNQQLREPRLTDFNEHAVSCGSCSKLVGDLKRSGSLC